MKISDVADEKLVFTVYSMSYQFYLKIIVTNKLNHAAFLFSLPLVQDCTICTFGFIQHLTQIGTPNIHYAKNICQYVLLQPQKKDSPINILLH